MHFSIQREQLLIPLQLVTGVVERRHTLPILSNVLLTVENNQLSLLGTDLEVELIGKVALQNVQEEGEVTVPAKKLMDICRSLPSEASIEIKLEDQKLLIKTGRSRFTLSTLAANDFPTVEDGPTSLKFEIEQSKLRRLIEHTSFAMAQQDVRYYLNGMLLELNNDHLKTVTTDGHRMAICSVPLYLQDISEKKQIILPRKAILELTKLLTDQEGKIVLTLGEQHIRATTGDFTFTSKLIDGKFPDYDRVLPKGNDKLIIADRQTLKESFTRIAILSNEKYRGIRLTFENNILKIQANNPEQEEAEEEIVIEYTHEPLEVGFNVSYLLEVLNVITTEKVRIYLKDPNSSALIQEENNDDSSYVIMPMRL